MSILSLLMTVVVLAASWRVYQKMGRQGWEGIIPFYSQYVLFDMLYGNGWKFLTLLIPIYNIVVLIRYNMDLAVRFHRSKEFGVGLALLAPVFLSILAFGNDVYLDGSQAVQGEDAISQAISKASSAVQGAAAPQAAPKQNDPMETLKQLNELYQQGIITEDEFKAKKAELLQKL